MIAGNDVGFSFFEIFFTPDLVPAAHHQQPYFHPSPGDADKQILSFWIRNQPGKLGGDKNDQESGDKTEDGPGRQQFASDIFNKIHTLLVFAGLIQAPVNRINAMFYQVVVCFGKMFTAHESGMCRKRGGVCRPQDQVLRLVDQHRFFLGKFPP